MAGWDGDALAGSIEEALEQPQIAGVNSPGERNLIAMPTQANNRFGCAQDRG